MERKTYVVRRRARFTGLDGPVNIPRGDAVEAVDGVLLQGGVPLCLVTSQTAHDYFAQDDDGQGLTRGALVAAILARLAKRDAGHQARWDRVWDDALCAQYRVQESTDYWLWDHDFYGAPIEDLRHIAALVGVREGTHE